MTMKKIVFLTGTRADFGKLKPLIEKIDNSKKFECFIFVTGMHTLSKYGSTYDEIKKNKYQNIFIFMNQTHTTDPDFILSNTITGFSNFVKEVLPDLIIVHGDRIEALAAATVGFLNNILVAHIEGGEVSGTRDGSIRHAITKLSHIHFVSNQFAKNRLLQLGENDENIYVIGSPDIDIIINKKLPTLYNVFKRYGIKFKTYSILLFHPITTELDTLKSQIDSLVSAVIESNENFIVIYPNNDNGADIILNSYERIKTNKRFKIFQSIRFEYFLTLLRNANIIVGNSSSGIHEADIFGISSINIGTRQNNRSKNPNIINVKGDKNEIIKMIKKFKGKKINPKYEFGDGKSVKRFYEFLNTKKFWSTPIQKNFIDK